MTTTTTRMMTAACLLLLLVLSAVLCGVTARPTEARFSVGGNAVARAGDVTYLFCNPEDRTADRPSSYVWVKDGQVSPGHTGHVLTLSSVTRQDAGYYQCGSPHSTGYGQGVHLKVFVPGDKLPRPNLQPFGWQIEGQPFSLFCNFFRDYIPGPATIYTWYINSVEIKGQKGDHLRFPNLTETDQGDYTCTAREGAAETTSPHSYGMDLRILVPAQVRMQPPGSVVRGVPGENLTLTCEVTRAFPDVPDDGYSWSYLPYPNGPLRPLEETGANLTLGPLTLEDRGQYWCQARNDQWYRHLDFTLGGNASVTVDLVYLDNLTLTPDLEVSEGARVTLTCAVDSRPTAQLAWTVHGQEVRHVTDNVDHYVISKAACSDSGNYTCAASNTELPGRHKHTSLQLHVHCSHIPVFGRNDPQIGAIFNFPLPDWTPMVVVHPRGHDIISVGQDCSYNVSPAFQSRCLQPWCDSRRHRLSFILTNVTEEDEGEYLCLGEGPQRNPLNNCQRSLFVNKFMANESKKEHTRVSVIALATTVSLLVLFIGVLIAVLLAIRYNHSLQNVIARYKIELLPVAIIADDERDATSLMNSGEETKAKENNDPTAERLFIHPWAEPVSDTDEVDQDESNFLLPSLVESPSMEQEVVTVLKLLHSTIQNVRSNRSKSLPSFILHSTPLSTHANVILLVDEMIGVVVIAVDAISNLKNERSAEKTVLYLMEARDTVRQKLQELVTSGAVQAILALPCLTHNEAHQLRKQLKVLRHHQEVGLLAGQDRKDFREWAERLGRRDEKEVWGSSCKEGESRDSHYTEVVKRL